MEVRINKFEEDLRRKNPNDSAYLDSMLSRFNRGLQETGLFKELKRREFYIKPSTIRSAKRRNKIIKNKQERRENALRARELQGYVGKGIKRINNSSKDDKRQ